MIVLVTEVVPTLGLARYRALFQVPHVRRLVLSGLLARLPMGMVGLALLLLVRENGGSYAAAGAVSGAYFVATAIGAPIAGRLVDRRGQTRILLPPRGDLPVPACSASARSRCSTRRSRRLPSAPRLQARSMPPVGASLRALWPRMFADAELRAAAYALEASLQEITFIVGPLLVALLTAAASPVLALGVRRRSEGSERRCRARRSGARVAAGGEARGSILGALESRGVVTIIASPAVSASGSAAPRSGCPPSPRATAAPSSAASRCRSSRPAAWSADSSRARG